MGDDQSASRTDATHRSPASGTVMVNGDPITVDRDTTVADLKDMAAVDPKKTATHLQDDDLYALDDDDHVLDKVADGDTISFQDVDTEGTYFGRSVNPSPVHISVDEHH